MFRFHLLPFFAVGFALAVRLHAEPVPVRWDPQKSTLLRGGEPYFIKGAGGETHLEKLKRCGGNSLRTWGADNLTAVLDKAQSLGLTVCAGIWLEPECAWFSYGNAEHCKRQAARVQGIIRKHRDHPALLLWGLGNEAEGDGKNAAFWQQIDRLAELTHAEDPAHPCFTALAGMTDDKAAGMDKHAPHLDFAGINTYAALPGLREHLQKLKWKRPWIVTEYGPQGFWERPRTAWGAPQEQTSTEKAAMFKKVYPAVSAGGACAGGYAFLWGHKHEATATWFGLLTESGETTDAVDVLEEYWTGKPPANRAPEIAGISGLPKSGLLKPGEIFKVRAEASDVDQDKLTFTWTVTSDEPARRDAKGMEIPPLAEEGAVQRAGESAAVTVPPKPGARWRLYVWVTDGGGKAATANVPFRAGP